MQNISFYWNGLFFVILDTHPDFYACGFTFLISKKEQKYNQEIRNESHHQPGSPRMKNTYR